MKGVIDTLKFTDSNGEKYNLYPRTLIECISNQNGDSLEDTLKEFIAENMGDVDLSDYVKCEELDKILDGTTPVGDSNKLGGKGSSEYATYAFETITTSVLEKTLSLPSPSIRVYKLDGDSYNGGDLPSEKTYMYSDAICIRHGVNTATVILTGYGIDAKRLAINYYAEGTWKGWDTNATTADLANYLPLSGGTINGNVTVKANGQIPIAVESNNSGASLMEFKGTNGRLGYFGFVGENKLVRTSSGGGTDYDILDSGNVGSYALPVNGGEIISRSQDVTVTFNDAVHNVVRIGFKSNGVHRGYLAQTEAEDGAFRRITPDGSAYHKILDTGNKPSGSYVGNGSATSRTINTGGIGNALLITSIKGFAIITYYGIMTTNSISSIEANFRNGVLTIASTNDLLNTNGETYMYQVL